MVWRCWGAGPPLVLLHGQSGSWRHWVRTIEPFATARQVWCPDLPSMGDSDLPPGVADVHGVAAATLHGLRAVPELARPFDLVGFSLGGIVGALAVTGGGVALRRFVAVGCTALGLPMPKVPLRAWRAEAVPARRRAVQEANLAALMLAGPPTPEALDLYAQDLERDRYAGKPIGSSTLLLDALSAIDAPVAGIWGACDALAGADPSRPEAAMRAVRPDLRFIVVPEAGHWVPYERPAAFEAALREVLA